MVRLPLKRSVLFSLIIIVGVLFTLPAVSVADDVDGSAEVIGEAQVYTNPASGVDTGSATLNAEIEYSTYDNVDVWFDWRPQGGTGWNTTSVTEGYEANSYSHDISGLASGTTYEYRGHIEYGAGEENVGSVVTFTTDSETAPPGGGGAPSLPELLYDVTIIADPSETEPGDSVKLTVGITQTSGSRQAEIGIDVWVEGGDNERVYESSVTRELTSGSIVRIAETDGWNEGVYTAHAKIGWDGKDASASTQFELISDGILIYIIIAVLLAVAAVGIIYYYSE
jgi:hypothetical protein